MLRKSLSALVAIMVLLAATITPSTSFADSHGFLQGSNNAISYYGQQYVRDQPDRDPWEFPECDGSRDGDIFIDPDRTRWECVNIPGLGWTWVVRGSQTPPPPPPCPAKITPIDTIREFDPDC